MCVIKKKKKNLSPLAVRDRLEGWFGYGLDGTGAGAVGAVGGSGLGVRAGRFATLLRGSVGARAGVVCA